MPSKNPLLLEDEQNRRRQLQHWIDANYAGKTSNFIRDNGLSQSEISSLLLGKRAFGEAKARSIEFVTKMPARFLEQRDQNDSASLVAISALLKCDLPVPVPESLRDICQIVVSNKWLRQNSSVISDVKNLRVLTGAGDSMIPFFSSGDPIIVDIGVDSIDRDGVYLFESSGQLLVKQLTLGVDGLINVSSTNPLLPLKAMTVDRESIRILGFVVKTWCSEIVYR